VPRNIRLVCTPLPTERSEVICVIGLRQFRIRSAEFSLANSPSIRREQKAH
jgi:hypothetical protein